MLRIDRKDKSLKFLPSSSLIDAGLKERMDIQAMIHRCPEPFFTEMGEPLLLVGQEVRPTDLVDDRIDLLAIDPQGNSVVIEIKRGTNKLHLLQGLTYASMIAKWDSTRLIEECSQQRSQTIEEVEEWIEDFLDEDIDNLNQSQRVILLADAFDYEVLAAAEWLNERYDVDIKCYRLSLSVDGENEFLACTCIYPAPELSAHAEKRGRGASRPLKWADWESALGTITNSAVSDFFREELAKGKQGYLRKRELPYRVDGKRRWNVCARQDRAYVWQTGRFQKDQEYWKKKIGAHVDVSPVKKDKCLRFLLSSAEDFRKFLDAVQRELINQIFSYSTEVLDEEETE
jgi:hypothetical protein